MAGARQWVLTFPHQVRHWLLRDGELFSAVIAEVNAVVSWFYELETIRGQEADLFLERAHGAVTSVQRFGSSLAENPHLHLIALDGVFARPSEGKRFFAFKDFDSSQVICSIVFA